MIKQILVWIDENAVSRGAVKWTLGLARALNAQVYAVYILPPEIKTGQKQRVALREEKAWAVLYEAEDEAFDQGVRISLLVETGEALQCLYELASSYKPDLVVVGAGGSIPAIELIQHLPRPVVFIKQYQ